MTIDDIAALPVSNLATNDAHLWLWTTNQFLEDGFRIMRGWGFKYLAPIHWVKPCGIGAWFVHRTQTLLFGYHEKCVFPLARYKPNIIEAPVAREHSAKPDQSYNYIEKISPGPRLELFAREYTPMFKKREGWDTWGNDIPNDVELIVS